MKNFDFIKKLEEEIPAFHQLHAYCDKAEIFQKAFPEESAATVSYTHLTLPTNSRV